MKLKIVVTKDLKFYDDQIERLNKLGDVIFYDNEPRSADEWLERCKGFDVICSGIFGLKSDNVYKLRNIFISLPFVGVNFLDKAKLKKKNIVVSNSPGCNKESVAEWMIGMILLYFRRLDILNRVSELPKEEIIKTRPSIFNKRITILGAGNIGKQLGRICKGFNMKIHFFRRGDDLIKSVKDADIIANCLSLNEETKGLLDKDFFISLKKGAFFISASRNQIYDIKALKNAINEGILVGAADDAADAEIGNIKNVNYKKLLAHPKIFVTPHIAWCTDIEIRNSNDIMIDNIEAWINKKPINLI